MREFGLNARIIEGRKNMCISKMHNQHREIAKLNISPVTHYCRDAVYGAAYGAARIPDNAAKIVVQRNDAAIYFSVRDRSAPG